MFEYSLQVKHISFPKENSDCAAGECLVLTDIYYLCFSHFLLIIVVKINNSLVESPSY